MGGDGGCGRGLDEFHGLIWVRPGGIYDHGWDEYRGTWAVPVGFLRDNQVVQKMLLVVRYNLAT